MVHWKYDDENKKYVRAMTTSRWNLWPPRPIQQNKMGGRITSFRTTGSVSREFTHPPEERDGYLERPGSRFGLFSTQLWQELDLHTDPTWDD